MSEMNFPFQRMTDPLLIPVGPTPSQLLVPNGFFTSTNGRYSSFLVVNKNRCSVRFHGFSYASSASPYLVTATTGWSFPPGHFGVYTTQYPDIISCIAEDSPLWPLADVTSFVPLEASYGYGV